jgi:hypothetical protein
MTLSYELQWWLLFGLALVEGALVIIALFCIAFEIHNKK